MRCTKCSFISFDDLSACAKCASDLSKLSKELNGTCTENRVEFFLGSAVQSSGLDEDNFSDSQMIPPIDPGDMNFDDTSTGGFSPLSAPSFDDTASVPAEDDVAIELGDIMPIDFGQFDSDSALPEGDLEHTDSLNLDNFNFDFDKTDAVSPPAADQAIDLDSTTAFSESTDDFQFDGDLSDLDIGDLSQDIPVVLADAGSSPSDNALNDKSGEFPEDAAFDFDQELFDHLADTSGSLDETMSLNDDISLDDTQVAFEPIRDGHSAPLELDESLVAELSRPASLDVSREFSMDFSDDHSASGDFELDAALVAELASGDEVAAKDSEDVLSVTGNFSADPVGIEDPLEFAHNLNVSEETHLGQIEDLTGEFPLIREEDTELVELDLTDIDVSDLLDTSDNETALGADDGRNQRPDLFGEQAELVLPAVDDTISEMVGNREDIDLDLPQDLFEEQANLDTLPSVDDTIREEAGNRDFGDLNQQQDLFVEQSNSGGLSTVDDTIREERGRRNDEPLDLQIDDDVVLEFDGEFLNEGIEGADELNSSGSDLVDLGEEIDLPEGNTPQDFSSSLLDDTFREGEPVDISLVSSNEVSTDDLFDDELILDNAVDDVDSLPSDIDVLALDADFEAFLNKTASVEEHQEVELVIDDDDDEEPPALPV